MVCGNFILPEPASYVFFYAFPICATYCTLSVLELPYTARSEYVLYRWNDVFGNAEKIRSMVDRLRFQVECFNEALPYEAGQSYGDRAASQVRVIYRIS